MENGRAIGNATALVAIWFAVVTAAVLGSRAQEKRDDGKHGERDTNQALPEQHEISHEKDSVIKATPSPAKQISTDISHNAQVSAEKQELCVIQDFTTIQDQRNKELENAKPVAFAALVLDEKPPLVKK